MTKSSDIFLLALVLNRSCLSLGNYRITWHKHHHHFYHASKRGAFIEIVIHTSLKLKPKPTDTTESTVWHTIHPNWEKALLQLLKYSLKGFEILHFKLIGRQIQEMQLLLISNHRNEEIIIFTKNKFVFIFANQILNWLLQCELLPIFLYLLIFLFIIMIFTTIFTAVVTIIIVIIISFVITNLFIRIFSCNKKKFSQWNYN